MSKAKGCLIATGIGCLVVIIVMSIFGFFAYKFGKKMYDEFMGQVTQFEEQGYKRVDGQVVTVTERVTEPTVYVAQTVEIQKGSDRGLALFTQTATIDGEVKGNVYFMGQVLTIEETAVLTHNLKVMAQQINLLGRLDGEIQGTYQVLNNPNAKAAPEPSPEPVPVEAAAP